MSADFNRIKPREKAFAIGLLVAMSLLAVYTALQVPKLKTHYDVTQFLPADHPLIKADFEVRTRFGLDKRQPILVTTEWKNGVWLTPERLKILAQISQDVSKIEGVERVQSLATIELVQESKSEMRVGKIGERFKGTEREKRDILSNPLMSPLLISKDSKNALIIVTTKTDHDTNTLKNVVGSIHKIVETSYRDIKVSVGGVPAIQTELSDRVGVELGRFMGFAMFAALLSLILVFRSWSTMLLPFVPIIYSVLGVLGLMVLMGYSLTVLAICIPILVAVNVLALSVHTLMRIGEEAMRPRVGNPKLSPKFDMIRHTFRLLTVPNMLTALTTAFGFATVAFTDVPLIKEFGIVVSISMFLSWLITELCLFPLALLFPMPQVRNWALAEGRWLDWIFKTPKFISLSIIVLSILMAAGGGKLSWSARLFDDLPAHVEARAATEGIDNKLGGTIPLELVITLPGKSNWKELAQLKRLDVFEKKVRTWPEIGSIVSAPDFVREMGGPQRALPKSSAALSETIFFMNMVENAPLRGFLSTDEKSLRMAVRLKDISSDRLEAASNRLRGEATQLFPGAKIEAAGMGSTIHTLNNSLSRELMFGFWPALAVIGSLLFLTFRSLRWTIIATLPNLVPTAILLGFLAWLQTPIKPGVAIVFSIALGIAFNNTVYFLQRIRDSLKEGVSVSDAVVQATRLEANPCLISTVCLLSGFVIFLMSEFTINFNFGLYMLLSLGFGIIGDLVFVPAFIKAFPYLLASEPAPAVTWEDQIPRNVDQNMRWAVSPIHPGGEKVKQNHIGRAASILLPLSLMMYGSSTSGAAAATPVAARNPNQILNDVRQRIQLPQEMARIKMVVKEADGQARDREIEIRRMNQSRFAAVKVKLLAPTDVRGVTFLSKSNSGKEEQWLYSPSSNRARRVVSGNKAQKFLDTEFTYNDFTAETYHSFTNTIVKEEPGGMVIVIESIAKDKDNAYSKIISWVNVTEMRMEKTEYFDPEGKLLKTMIFKDYQKFGDALRAKTIEVRNLQTNRSTVLQLAGLRSGNVTNRAEFSPEALNAD